MNGAAFTDSLVTLTMTGDTSSIDGPAGSPTSYALGGTVRVAVAGTGSDTITDVMEVMVSQGPNVIIPTAFAGFIDLVDIAGVFTGNSGFDTYTMATGISLSGTSYRLTSVSSVIFGTAGIGIQLFGPFNADHPATFTATLAPEPGTWVLVLGGLGCVWFARRKHAQS